MTDSQLKTWVTALVVMLLLVMFWNMFSMVIDLIIVLTGKSYSVTDIGLIVGPLGAAGAGIAGYAFQILIKDKK